MPISKLEMESRKYLKFVQWSLEDQCYVGICPGLVYGGVHGDNEIKVYKELCAVVEEAIDLYKKDKKPLPKATATKIYSGKFVLRVDKDLHMAISLRALENGDSINNYCQKILKASVMTSHPVK